MMQSRWQTWVTWWQECAHWLYLAYFKPFTLAEHLHSIHPRLEPDRNPYELRKDFARNPVLARYACQMRFLVLITALGALGLFSALLALLGHPFSWWRAVLAFAAPYAVGVQFTVYPAGIWLEEHDTLLDMLVALSAILFFVFDRILVSGSLLAISLAVLSFAVIGIYLGAKSGLTQGIASGAASAVALSAIYSMGFGLAGSQPDGVIFGVAGVAVGLTLGAMALQTKRAKDRIVDIVAIDAAILCVMGVVASLVDIPENIATFVVFVAVVGVSVIVSVLRLWVWPFEVVWMLVLRATASDERAGRAWRWLPIHYDELIVLPLPFLGQFLAEACRHNQPGAHKAVRYLTEHSRQQRAAHLAQVVIGLNRLTRCRNTDEIAAAHTERDWSKERLPPELGSAFLGLLDVSHDVAASQKGTTRHQQAEGFRRQVERLRELQEGLANESRGTALQYGQIIDRWAHVLAAEVQVLEEQVGAEAEIPPVYVASIHLRPDDR